MWIQFLLLFALCYSSELFEEFYPEAEEFMANMTLEEKVGQLFYVRYYEDKALDDIQNLKLGGFVLFAKDFNYEEKYIQNYMKKLMKTSLESTNLPIALAVDEEGGTVNRVSLYHRKAGIFPSPMDIYKESGIEGILEIDQEKRDLLRKFYININLAPVADVSYNSTDYMYYRTLGKDSNETAEYIAEDVDGYVNDKFTCCAKHFPGYGNNVNTHDGIAYDNRSYETFLNEDFKPFEAAIENKIPMILVSHNIVLCKDKKYPASISKAWHDILREDLNFSGLIITDDLYMNAISKYSYGESPAVLSLQAGNDIVLTTDYHKHINDVLEAIKVNNITMDTINNACRRVIAWKLKYLNFTIPDIDEDETSDNDTTDSENDVPSKKDPDDDNSALIISLSVVGGVILIGVIVVLILCHRKKINSTDIEEGTGKLLKDI